MMRRETLIWEKSRKNFLPAPITWSPIHSSKRLLVFIQTFIFIMSTSRVGAKDCGSIPLILLVRERAEQEKSFNRSEHFHFLLETPARTSRNGETKCALHWSDLVPGESTSGLRAEWRECSSTRVCGTCEQRRKTSADSYPQTNASVQCNTQVRVCSREQKSTGTRSRIVGETFSPKNPPGLGESWEFGPNGGARSCSNCFVGRSWKNFPVYLWRDIKSIPSPTIGPFSTSFNVQFALCRRLPLLNKGTISGMKCGRGMEKALLLPHLCWCTSPL